MLMKGNQIALCSQDLYPFLLFLLTSYLTSDSPFPQSGKPYPIQSTEGLSEFIVPKAPHSLRFYNQSLANASAAFSSLG